MIAKKPPLVMELAAAISNCHDSCTAGVASDLKWVAAFNPIFCAASTTPFPNGWTSRPQVPHSPVGTLRRSARQLMQTTLAMGKLFPGQSCRSRPWSARFASAPTIPTRDWLCVLSRSLASKTPSGCVAHRQYPLPDVRGRISQARKCVKPH